MSTDSGLPDYRGTGSTPKPPVDIDMFTVDPIWYRWLWYRNEVTWRSMDALRPNAGHGALAELAAAGVLLGVATQNVDRLDTRAGTDPVWELHGRHDIVECLGCGQVQDRATLSARLVALNPDLVHDLDPGHVEITPQADRAAAEGCSFTPVRCEQCGGVLKPGIVMFGQSLPESALGPSIDAARDCDVVLVCGTSLAVSTGMIVVSEALRSGAALAVVNLGPAAVDRLADVRIADSTTRILPALSAALSARPGTLCPN
ncbi:NAD-dependent deacetylase [Schaalia sp. 19OD2882]|nr:NAD-dependent deacetylase [Schaalia sp. 19OD2882]